LGTLFAVSLRPTPSHVFNRAVSVFQNTIVPEGR
jgi:hypothetical protein